MAVILALEKLYDDVVARFAAEGFDVPNVFGWETPRHRGAQQNRICWVPGDPAGAVGAVGPARFPGGNPRSLGTLEETFTVYVEGRDLSAPEDERAQWKATRLIFDAWFRAAYKSVRDLLSVKSADWMVERTTRRHGATLRAVCTIQALIPDTAYPIVEDDTRAEGVVILDSDGDEGTPGTSEDLDVPPLEEP